jgi:hypothetical protein
VIRSARGAIIIQVAFALIALLAFLTFVIDQGVAFVARRQAQNAADAGALAAAVTLMNDRSGGAGAEAAARHFASVNPVWGEATAQAHIIVPTPPIACPDGVLSCIRVDVLRGQPDRDGNPHTNTLPTFFGHLVGVTQQGVRATATAQVGAGNALNCVKPWAVPDKWTDNSGTGSNTGGWDLQDEFNVGVDVFTAPGYRAEGENNDVGLQLGLKAGPGGDATPGWFRILELGGGNGSPPYEAEVRGCPAWVPTVGMYDGQGCDEPGDIDIERGCIGVRTGNRAGPTRDGVNYLVDLDPDAYWDTATNTVQGGCTAAGTCRSINPLGLDISPRVIAVPVFNPQSCLEPGGGCSGGNNTVIEVTNVLGFFLEGMCPDVFHGPTPAWCGHPNQFTVVGRLTRYPAMMSTNAGSAGPASFLKVVRLIR